ncbi:hypothetical protein T484DRAFT_1841694, partial [Baffinella frigidus]
MGENLPAVDLGAGRTAVVVSAGYSHTCALLDDATVKCWGYNANGELGYGDTKHRGDGTEGRYSASSGLAECAACTAGSYSAAAGASTSTACTP